MTSPSVTQLRDPLVLVLLVAVAGAVLLQLAAVFLPPLRDLLGTRPVGLADLLIVGAAATFGYAAIRLDRIVYTHRVATPTG